MDLDTVQAIADEIGGDVYRGYSGRGMYGARCLGITCKEPPKCVKVALRYDVRGAQVDSMGLDFIVYWPSLSDEVAPA